MPSGRGGGYEAVMSLSTMSDFTPDTTAPVAAIASSSAPSSTSTLARWATTLS